MHYEFARGSLLFLVVAILLCNTEFSSLIVGSSTIDIFYQIYTFYQNRYQIYIFYENSYQIYIFYENRYQIYTKFRYQNRYQILKKMSMVDELTITWTNLT